MGLIKLFMELFGHHHKDEMSDKEVISFLLKNERLLVQLAEDAIHRIPKPENQHNKPIFTLSINTNSQILIMANVALVIGSPKTGLFTLIDNKTLLPITGVKYSNQALGANSNPEFATFALALTDPADPASLNSVIGTPVAAGSGTLVITTDASYTDPGDGSAQSGSFSVTKAFNVVASADGASFDVVFP
jgi:hypothetical protein